MGNRHDWNFGNFLLMLALLKCVIVLKYTITGSCIIGWQVSHLLHQMSQLWAHGLTVQLPRKDLYNLQNVLLLQRWLVLWLIKLPNVIHRQIDNMFKHSLLLISRASNLYPLVYIISPAAMPFINVTHLCVTFMGYVFSLCNIQSTPKAATEIYQSLQCYYFKRTIIMLCSNAAYLFCK